MESARLIPIALFIFRTEREGLGLDFSGGGLQGGIVGVFQEKAYGGEFLTESGSCSGEGGDFLLKGIDHPARDVDADEGVDMGCKEEGH